MCVSFSSTVFVQNGFFSDKYLASYTQDAAEIPIGHYVKCQLLFLILTEIGMCSQIL
jgi:hypothetical protein